MTFADPTQTSAPKAAAAAAPKARVRDIRLDFFRGLAMFIILFAHTGQFPDLVDPGAVRLFRRDGERCVLFRHGLGHRLWRDV